MMLVPIRDTVHVACCRVYTKDYGDTIELGQGEVCGSAGGQCRVHTPLTRLDNRRLGGNRLRSIHVHLIRV